MKNWLNDYQRIKDDLLSLQDDNWLIEKKTGLLKLYNTTKEITKNSFNIISAAKIIQFYTDGEDIDICSISPAFYIHQQN
jgi:hypothetical protein